MTVQMHAEAPGQTQPTYEPTAFASEKQAHLTLPFGALAVGFLSAGNPQKPTGPF